VSGTRKIAAIVVADIVGFSRLAGTDEDRTLSRLRGLRSDLIDPAIDAHHGRIVKRTGDGSLIEFRSVVDAVRCAIEVQNGMAERNAGLPPERRIEFRVGIHLGDVVEESDGDLMGDGVNIAARLEGVCEPGAICLSEDAYRQVKGRLDLAVTDLGPAQLKNIVDPIRVYSLQVGKPAQQKLAEAKPPEKPPAPEKRSRLALRGAGIAALLLLIASVWYFLAANHAKSPATAAHLSVVVLPFANLSGDPAQDYLADALTDELTTAIARVPNSFVIARNTAFTYKGKPVDAKAIGKDLGVRYVLEGSVQPTGDRMRVNAQLIDAESGAHLWADQFDTPRADLLQMQDEIVTRLANAMHLQLPEAEAARLKRTPAANPNAEDLALQCEGVLLKGGVFLGKEADVAYHLCEQALAVDPNNDRALSYLSTKYWLPVGMGVSADPKADLERADELASRAIALNPNADHQHNMKAMVLLNQARYDESIAESERALALNPSNVFAYMGLGWACFYTGQFEKSLEYFDKAIRLSPHDPGMGTWLDSKSGAHFALKQYDQAIEWARRAVVIDPSFGADLVAPLALSGHETEAREALQRYLALPSSDQPKTIAGWKAYNGHFVNANTDPRLLEAFDRFYEAVRKAGMPEQ
jgi:TolB-like protein/class 3 adenylate cyclase